MPFAVPERHSQSLAPNVPSMAAIAAVLVRAGAVGVEFVRRLFFEARRAFGRAPRFARASSVWPRQAHAVLARPLPVARRVLRWRWTPLAAGVLVPAFL